MKDYLSAAFALLAATSQAAVLQADTDAQAIVFCQNPAVNAKVEYKGYCYAPKNPLATTPPDDCCWLYPDANFGGDQRELCFSTVFDAGHSLHRTETVWHSFAGNNDFDNDAESWQCGANAALMTCNDTINTNAETEDAWTYECTGSQGPLYTGGSNSGNMLLDWNTNNFASTIVIKPIEKCAAQLTLYSEASCTGESRVILNNQMTEAQLLAFFIDPKSRVKSFMHGEGSIVKIYGEENLQGEFYEAVSDVNGDWICVTATQADGTAIPQKSLEFINSVEQKECACEDKHYQGIRKAVEAYDTCEANGVNSCSKEKDKVNEKEQECEDDGCTACDGSTP